MSAAPKANAPHPTGRRSVASDISELVKARLTLLVILTTLVGFFMGSRGPIDGILLAATLVGTAFLAGGAAVLNQYAERDIDRLMVRTRERPLPAGRVSPSIALGGGTIACVIGIAVLALSVNPESAIVGALTLASYLFVYTPLKRLTPLNTLVGAVPGALPPVIGWVAARGEIGWTGWSLFVLQFFWQVPHFLAIAWLYRADYARAGLRMLPLSDPDGRRTALHALCYAGGLLAVSLGPWRLGMAGGWYAAAAIVAGLGFLALAVDFRSNRSDSRARRLFLGSVIYLPVVLGLMVWDRAG